MASFWLLCMPSDEFELDINFNRNVPGSWAMTISCAYTGTKHVQHSQGLKRRLATWLCHFRAFQTSYFEPSCLLLCSCLLWNMMIRQVLLLMSSWQHRILCVGGNAVLAAVSAYMCTVICNFQRFQRFINFARNGGLYFAEIEWLHCTRVC